MLEQLIVKDFALSQSNSLDFNKGMTCITGETGTGKSLTVDALSLLLGGRADSMVVRNGCPKAELNAVFSVAADGELAGILKEHGIETEDDGSLYLRRIITNDGKSKAYINNSPCTLSVLKDISSYLVAIHGQHASVRLIDKNNQLKLLDSFARLKDDVEKVDKAFDSYNQQRHLLQELADEQMAGASEYKTKRFELDTLNRLDLHEGDYERISSDYDALQHQAQAQDAVSLALAVLENDEHNIIDIISARISDLTKVSVFAKGSIDPVIDDFTKAAEHLDSARERLSDLVLKANPQQEEELSEKLSKCHEMARRFEVLPSELYKVRDRLEKDLEHFLSLKDRIAALTENVKTLRATYEQLASQLSEKRAEAARKMSSEVTSKIRDLAMPDGIFEVSVSRDDTIRPRRGGRDNVVFLFTANLGEEPKDLGAVASGGELSRLALAIEVLTSSAGQVQTMIFDEVDTGISGRTASCVGQLLKLLGQSVQVVTVTHLPQVAACADHHFLVSKHQQEQNVISSVEELDAKGRIEELSRMMGGNVVTEATRESARALLNESGRNSGL
ncbi:MAG: DNA repair protein RecN [Succinivibrio sp.]